MTAAPSDLHRVLASPLVRRQVARAVARRVPEDAAEDVVQAVYCDALAARNVPSADEVPRWLFAIARNKVADFHRKRRTTAPIEIEPMLEEPHEARDLLVRAARVAPDPRAFEWIVRVEQGESLSEIAREEKLPAPAVRQRVSRLRRALRAMLLAAAVIGIALLVHFGRAVETIGPEPSPAATIDGRWHVVRVDCPSDAPAAACRAARFARVDIHGRTGTIEVGGGSVALDIDDLERVYHAHIIAVGNTLRVESDLGGVTLERD